MRHPDTAPASTGAPLGAGGPLSVERRGAVAVLRMDSPPVNALGATLRAALLEALEAALGDPAIAAIVLTGSGGGFCAGLDIREIDAARDEHPPAARDLVERIEGAGKPVVAALHGYALGAGFELALGCHLRVAAPGTRVSLPQSRLGLIPGAGGTQRLPRVIGLNGALDVILSGEPIDDRDAVALRIFDRVARDDLVGAAVEMAGEAGGGGLPRARDGEIRFRRAASAADVVAGARRRIERRARGLIAPWRALESVENALTMPFDAGVAREAALYRECRDSPQSRALRNLFFAEREAGTLPAAAGGGAAGIPEIGSAAVVGCGAIGTGVTIALASAGIPVRVLEASGESLEKGLAAVRAALEDAVSVGRIARADADRRLALVGPAAGYGDIADADVVVEAVVEDTLTKETVFRLLDDACKPSAILASSASAPIIDALAAVTGRGEQVLGMHFHFPANVTRVVELVCGEHTSQGTVASALALCRRLGKAGVLARNADGFIGARLFACVLRHACLLLEEGASPQQVDRVAHEFGFPMGPFTMSDVVGLEGGWRFRETRTAGTVAGRPRAADSPLPQRLCALGRLGRRTGAGWYAYDGEGRMAFPDPEVERVAADRAAEIGLEPRRIPDEEILERCLFGSINEAARLLGEGVALRPGDVDVVSVYALGFPAHRGGPLYHADRAGPQSVCEGLARYQGRLGDLMRPAPLLREAARDGRRFYRRRGP